VFKLIYILELVSEQTETSFSNLNNGQPDVTRVRITITFESNELRTRV